MIFLVREQKGGKPRCQGSKKPAHRPQFYCRITSFCTDTRGKSKKRQTGRKIRKKQQSMVEKCAKRPKTTRKSQMDKVKNFRKNHVFGPPTPQKFFKKGHRGPKNIKISRSRVRMVHFRSYWFPDGGFWGQAIHSQHPFLTIPLESPTSRKKFKFFKHFQGRFWEPKRCPGEPPEDPEWRSTVDAPFRA